MGSSNVNIHKVFETLLVATVISTLLLPSFKVSSNLSLRLDDFISLFLFPLLIFLLISRFPTRTPVILLNSNLLILYILVHLFFIFCCIRGYFVLGVPFSSGDVNELIRLLKPLFLIIACSYINTPSFKRKISKTVELGSIYVSILGFLQFFNPLGLGNWIAKIYGEHHVDIMVDASEGARRVILSGAGPNDGALIALVLLIFCFFLYQENFKRRFLYYSIGLLFAIIFTSSRTTLLAFTFLAGIALLNYGKIWYKMVFLVFAIGVSYYILPYFTYIYQGFQVALEGQNTSLISRMVKWNDALNLFKQSKLFGWGIAKSIHITTVDSEYVLILRRYGVVGLILVLLFIYYPYFMRIKKADFLIKSVKFFALSSSIIMITNNFFNSYQIVTAFVVFLAVACKEQLEYTFNEKLKVSG